MSNKIKVNAQRLLCPLPVIRLQDAVMNANPGDLVEIVCTDPGSMNDIPAWCRINGHQLETLEHVSNEFSFTVKVIK